MTLDLIFALTLGFFGMIGIYTLLRRLEYWLLRRSDNEKVLILIRPCGDPAEKQTFCRRLLLRLEAHPLSAGQRLLILDEDGAEQEESYGLMGEKTPIVCVRREELAGLFEPEPQPMEQKKKEPV